MKRHTTTKAVKKAIRYQRRGSAERGTLRARLEAAGMTFSAPPTRIEERKARA